MLKLILRNKYFQLAILLISGIVIGRFTATPKTIVETKTKTQVKYVKAPKMRILPDGTIDASGGVELTDSSKEESKKREESNKKYYFIGGDLGIFPSYKTVGIFIGKDITSWMELSVGPTVIHNHKDNSNEVGGNIKLIFKY